MNIYLFSFLLNRIFLFLNDSINNVLKYTNKMMLLLKKLPNLQYLYVKILLAKVINFQIGLNLSKI